MSCFEIVAHMNVSHMTALLYIMITSSAVIIKKSIAQLTDFIDIVQLVEIICMNNHSSFSCSGFKSC